LFKDKEIRQKNLIPLQFPQLKGMGSTLALGHEWVREEAKSFGVTFIEAPDKGGEATLQVRWGNHLLSAPVSLDLSKAPWIQLDPAGG
jgi:hypothetical protein